MGNLAYKNLNNPINTDSGIAEYALVAPFSDFAVNGIKGPAAPFTTLADMSLVKQAHVFKDAVNGGFAKFALAPDKNEYEATAGGDKGFVKLTHTVKLFIPGSYAELHGSVYNMLNKPHILLVRDANCNANMYYQIGTTCGGAFMSASFKTATTADGVKGWEVTFEAKGGPVLIYAGPEPKVLEDDVLTAPEVVLDDTANTLTFSTPNGGTIYYSENGGAYQLYTAPINVGTGGRAAGYYKAYVSLNGIDSVTVDSPAVSAG